MGVDRRPLAAGLTTILLVTAGCSGKAGTVSTKESAKAFSPAKVATAAQGFITEKLAFANAPATFVQGPNNNG